MKRIAILFGIFLIIIVILADTDHLPGFIHAIYDFPYGDKAGHFILLGLLSFFTTWAFIPSPSDATSKRTALTIALILMVVIAAEEFSQKFFPTRTYDMLDLSASYLGVITGGLLALKYKK